MNIESPSTTWTDIRSSSSSQSTDVNIWMKFAARDPHHQTKTTSTAPPSSSKQAYLDKNKINTPTATHLEYVKTKNLILCRE